MQKLYETEEKAKRAFLVSLVTRKPDGREESLCRELRGLAETLGLEIAGHETVHVRNRQPKFGMGTGKAGELAKRAVELEADCMVFDWDPSPSQQRDWEELAGISVVDRQELIIRIFADRANTREAELQIKLAELLYLLPRLSHKYIDLSRQRGGSYGTRGAGETRLETDRRQIERRIQRLQKELEELRKQRQLRRRQRERQGLPVCAIVGYTNAGKSSLLNALTGADVPVGDKLFATLDATTRRFEPEPGMAALLTDTVGFIRRLPHSLIKAFRSTLEEAALAELLIHVLDAAEPDIESFFETTLSVLRELGAEDIPMITVLNKIDRVTALPSTAESALRIEDLLLRFPESVALSAKNGTGLDELKKRIAFLLKEPRTIVSFA
ncbi:MAG: GTPase HflX [Treponema sp.]|jgi:GTP-binding protein HflX|nr:GTPase HflX [Treponema sp.]